MGNAASTLPRILAPAAAAGATGTAVWQLWSGPARARRVAGIMLGSTAASAVAYAAAVRRTPIQRSLDLAVPLEVAYDQWLRLGFLPEGGHRVESIERREETLRGRIPGRLRSGWEAEIIDERDGESFAWRSVSGSDCVGLITFHRLADRLTRIELGLDVRPRGPGEMLALALRIADRQADVALRRFKARLEAISPDAYGEDDPEQTDNEGKET